MSPGDGSGRDDAMPRMREDDATPNEGFPLDGRNPQEREGPRYRAGMRTATRLARPAPLREQVRLVLTPGREAGGVPEAPSRAWRAHGRGNDATPSARNSL